MLRYDLEISGLGRAVYGLDKYGISQVLKRIRNRWFIADSFTLKSDVILKRYV
jgi:hypothetical protein